MADTLKLGGNGDYLLDKPTKFRADRLGEVTLKAEINSMFGGMGCVYFKDGKAFKIYHDPQKAADQQLPERLKALTKLKHKGIVGPRGLIYDRRSNFAGYWMPVVQGESLRRFLNLQYQQEHGIGVPELITFLEHKREVMQFAHDHGAIIGDPNENNGIVRKVPRKGLFCFHIDVDNWGIESYPTNVVAPHVQDHQHKGPFTQLTDWYGEAIVWFWLMHLDHPFGGRLKGFDHRAQEHWLQRMKAGKSIFHDGVRFSAATRALSELPPTFLDWCGRVFEHGERGQPPSLVEGIKVPEAAKTMSSTASTAATKRFEQAGDQVIRGFSCGLVLTQSGGLFELESGNRLFEVPSTPCEAVRVDDHHYLIGWMEDDEPNFACVDKGGNMLPLQGAFAGQALWRRDDRLYVIGEQNVIELKLWLMGGNTAMLTAANDWPVASGTMTWLNQIGVQSVYGQSHLWVPFVAGVYTTLRVPELDGFSPVASHVNGRHVVITALGKAGRVIRLNIKFKADFSGYEVQAEDIASPGLNLTILDKGLVVEMEQDGEISLSIPLTDRRKMVADRHLKAQMRLWSVGDTILYAHEGAVWHLQPK